MTYGWLIGDRVASHWSLEQKGQNEVALHVGLGNLVEDLREGVFGPKGYFQGLQSDSGLQQRYAELLKEFDSYKLK